MKSELDGVTDELKHDLDSMSEMGEMESLRLHDGNESHVEDDEYLVEPC